MVGVGLIVVKLLADGSLDPGFPQVTSTLPEYFGIPDFPDWYFWIHRSGNDFFVAGSFGEANSEFKDLGYQHSGLFKINGTGQVQTAFSPPTPFALAFPNIAIPLDSSRILLGGSTFPHSYTRINSMDAGGFALVDVQTGEVTPTPLAG